MCSVLSQYLPFEEPNSMQFSRPIEEPRKFVQRTKFGLDSPACTQYYCTVYSIELPLSDSIVSFVLSTSTVRLQYMVHYTYNLHMHMHYLCTGIQYWVLGLVHTFLSIHYVVSFPKCTRRCSAPFKKSAILTQVQQLIFIQSWRCTKYL